MDKIGPFTINGVNQLPLSKQREIFASLIPLDLIKKFNFQSDFLDESGHDLLRITSRKDCASVEMALFHRWNFMDPVLYGHICDTINGQIHVLLYVLNDPYSPRFNIDCMPDGSSTRLGSISRNIPAELEAMQFGLSPGQIRRGLRMLGNAIATFEQFVISLGHDLYFADPLYYHNAILFERYGFAYQKGRKLMERIQSGFDESGDLRSRLDDSTPFRSPLATDSIRLRSWAIHDGIMGEPFNNVVMYKPVGKDMNINTCMACNW